MAAPEPLRLLAQDADDLAVISAALQDAVARIGDIRFEASARRLTVALNRFRWGSRRSGPRARAVGAAAGQRPGGEEPQPAP